LENDNKPVHLLIILLITTPQLLFYAHSLLQLHLTKFCIRFNISHWVSWCGSTSLTQHALCLLRVKPHQKTFAKQLHISDQIKSLETLILVHCDEYRSFAQYNYM